MKQVATMGLLLLALGMSSCGGGISEEERLATAVVAALSATNAAQGVVDTGVAQAFTATALNMPTESAPTEAAGATASPTIVPTTDSPIQPATVTPAPPSTSVPAPSAPPPPTVTVAATQPNNTVTPTNTPAELQPVTNTPEPTNEPTPTPPPVAAIVPFGGSTEGLEAGGIFAPGNGTSELIFRDMLTLRVDVRDPDVSGDDGIESVTFFITRYEADGSTTPVYEKVELNRAYCLFGGDDENCPAIELGPAATWPGGAAITPGDYHVEIAIVAENPARFAFWNFDFVIE